MSILVLGLGNILLSDEGIGVRVVEHLSQRFRFPPAVELMDGGTAGMELLGPMMDRDLILIVDAVRTGAPPGSVVELRGEQVPAFFRTKLSPHQVHIADVLATLAIMQASPKAIVVIGVEPVSLATGLDLTPAVAARFGQMVDRVLAELAAAGFEAQPLCEPPPRSLLLEAGAFAA